MAQSYSLDLLIQTACNLGVSVPENRNLLALSMQVPIRLEIRAANLQRSAPEFSKTVAAGKKRKRELELEASGYRVQVMQITDSGGLRAV